MCSKDYLNCGGRCPADIHTHCLFQGSLGPSGPQKALREQALDSGHLEVLSLEALSLEALSLEALSRCLEPLSKCRGGGGQELEGEGVRQGRSSSLLLGRKPGLSPSIGLGQAMRLGTASSPYWR